MNEGMPIAGDIKQNVLSPERHKCLCLWTKGHKTTIHHLNIPTITLLCPAPPSYPRPTLLSPAPPSYPPPHPPPPPFFFLPHPALSCGSTVYLCRKRLGVVKKPYSGAGLPYLYLWQPNSQPTQVDYNHRPV